jgi:hypothetical protein
MPTGRLIDRYRKSNAWRTFCCPISFPRDMLVAMQPKALLPARSGAGSLVPCLIRIAICILTTLWLIEGATTRAMAESGTPTAAPSAPLRIEALRNGAVP